jgi:alkylated DNA nucleotide flippase Atl1
MFAVDHPGAPSTPGRGAFVDAVVDCVRTIPAGRVLSYGDVAAVVASRSPRAVGRVLAHVGGGIPWHRVVRADGSFAPHIREEQRRRLADEGIPITGDRVDMSDAAGIRWRPQARR